MDSQRVNLTHGDSPSTWAEACDTGALLTVTDAAALAGVGRSKVARLRKQHGIDRHCRVCARWLHERLTGTPWVPTPNSQQETTA